jgi:hypothetical protein
VCVCVCVSVCVCFFCVCGCVCEYARGSQERKTQENLHKKCGRIQFLSFFFALGLKNHVRGSTEKQDGRRRAYSVRFYIVAEALSTVSHTPLGGSTEGPW